MVIVRYLIVLCLISLELASYRGNAFFVNITYVESAIHKGAVCLDGSPPAYHFARGFGAGVNKWLIQIEGGGWCNNITSCLERSRTRLGSSKQMVKQLAFSAILSNKKRFNPDFYDWNKIKFRYCDGASFTGDVDAVDPVTGLHYRGARIFDALVDALMEHGMRYAKNAILSGCSAGGLASILHCDHFRALLPSEANVKCISDAGYFVNARDLNGQPHIQQFYDDVVNLHGSARNLPLSCTATMKPGLCFFPENVASHIDTPLFILNAAYDSWQIKNVLAPGAVDPRGHWHKCKMDIENCNIEQIANIQDFRTNFLRAFRPVISSSETGFFINSCYAHCQSEQQIFWLTKSSPQLEGTTISEAVGDWYRGDGFRSIDCAYPCDSTCIGHVYGNQDPHRNCSSETAGHS